MITKRKVCIAIAAAFIVASGAVYADVVGEQAAANDPINLAQPLLIDASGGVTVRGVLGTSDPAGTVSGDLDFYSFEGREGDVVTFDIDYGMKPAGSTERSVDTVLGVFGPGPDYALLRMNDDGGILAGDPESISSADSRILNFRLPASGTYTVGVSSFPRAFINGGGVTRTTLGTRSNGRYELVISGVTPSIQHINVEIKPGSGDYAPINPKARGNVPVALLSSSEFDALTVVRDSLTFGATGKESSLLRCNKEGADVNGDGKPDLVCHFDNQAASFEPGDLEGVVMGRLQSGRMFEGRGLLKVVPRDTK